MLPMQRREKIKAILREQKSVTVLELMEYFNVTNETIRRDLLALEEEGFVSRVHGGAYIEGGTTNEINISLRRTTHSAQKQQIAAVCERIIQNGDSIFLDSSTTANYIAEKLTNYRLTVLTNSIQIINTLASFSGISLIMVGGNFDKKSQSFYGTRALEFVRSYHVDKAFFSCRSINYKSGVMDSNEKTSDIRRMIIDQSARAYLCVDSSKFGANSFVSICNFDALTGLITDHIPSEEWRTFLSKSGLSTYAYDELDTAAPLASPAEEQQAE